MSDRLFCYYGDDFTGSTDALEALAGNGVPTVLFLDPPSAKQLADFPECLAIGIAGESRSRDPEWMSRELPAIFQNLKSYGAPVCQYKVCSTFDSSPEFGNIGRAIEVGQQEFGCSCTPVVVGAPHLKRYLLFGNLFAAGGAEIHRIDRHPTMSRHPVTPMDEGDLRRHLARQTSRRSGLVDILALEDGTAQARFDELRGSGVKVIFFDGLHRQSLQETGKILWSNLPQSTLFAVGSAGLTHAMIQHWRSIGLAPQEFKTARPARVDRLLVLSGSCSPVTAEQIQWATARGFESLRVPASILSHSGEQEELVAAALQILERGSSAILYTASGPRDYTSALQGIELSSTMGRLLREILLRSGLRRAVVAGGDTSSHSVRQLGIDALTFIAALSPGAPLCRGRSDNQVLNGIELVLKGGQVGAPDFFGNALGEQL